MRLSKGDIAFTISALSIAVSLGAWLYLDLNRSVNAGNRKAIGKIVFKERVAQRRLSREAVWDNLRNETPVYDGDTIRTENLSEAEIVLNNNSRIALEENTLIVLNFAGDEARLDFSYGGIRAESSGKNDLKVKSGQTEVSLSGANARLSGDNPGSLQVEVRKGTANLERDGKKGQVTENQVASLDKGEFETKTLPASLQSPGDGERILAESGQRSVAFRWTAAKPTVFELSRTRDFRSIVTRQPSRGAVDVMLSAGPYFWRVVPEGESPTLPRSLSVLQPARVALHSPASGASLSIRGEQAPVQFSWSSLDLASSYEVQIFKGPDGKEPLRQEVANTSLLALSLAPGTYSWRIVPRSSVPDAALPSALGSFTVRHLEKMPAPVPISPSAVILLQKTVEDQGLAFSWKTAADGGSYRLQVANNPAFANPVVNEATGAGSLVIKRSFPEGKLFWRVVTEEGEPSGVLDFQIRAHAEVTPIFPVARRQVSLTSQERLVVRWQGMQGIPGSYHLVASRSADLSNPAFDGNVEGEAGSLNLEPGTYFWRVVQLDTGGKILGESRIEQFSLQIRLLAPVPIYPQAQSVVDMSKLDGIPFRWNPIQGATGYQFRLFRDAGAKRVVVFETRTNRPDLAFTRLDLLDTDVFVWSVSALGASGEGESALVPFRISLDEQSQKPQFISPDTIFVK